MEKLFAKMYVVMFTNLLMASKDNYIRVLVCIIRHTNYQNEMCLTLDELSKLVGCSKATVNRVIKDLVACDFMRATGGKCYMINPSCLMRGKYYRFYGLMDRFNTL